MQSSSTRPSGSPDTKQRDRQTSYPQFELSGSEEEVIQNNARRDKDMHKNLHSMPKYRFYLRNSRSTDQPLKQNLARTYVSAVCDDRPLEGFPFVHSDTLQEYWKNFSRITSYGLVNMSKAKRSSFSKTVRSLILHQLTSDHNRFRTRNLKSTAEQFKFNAGSKSCSLAKQDSTFDKNWNYYSTFT
ncbi:hypothetical protein Tco_0777513 [Tanacetum coccineum]